MLKEIVAEHTTILTLKMENVLSFRDLVLTQCDLHIAIKHDQGVQVNSFGFNLGIRDKNIDKYYLTEDLKGLFCEGLDLSALSGISEIEIILIDASYPTGASTNTIQDS